MLSLEKAFIAWGWHSTEEYEEHRRTWAMKKEEPGISEQTKLDIQEFLDRLKKERAKYAKFFAG